MASYGEVRASRAIHIYPRDAFLRARSIFPVREWESARANRYARAAFFSLSLFFLQARKILIGIKTTDEKLSNATGTRLRGGRR